jgi:hypothetical protein
MSKPTGFLPAIIALSIAISQGLSGQAVHGMIVGAVTDPTGAVVPGAKVVIRDTDRGTTTTATTNNAGIYRQGFLIVGRYSVQVEHAGFQTVIRDNVSVSVDNEAVADVQLKVGDTTETVQVSGQASVLQTERSDVAIVFNQKLVEDLPC